MKQLFSKNALKTLESCTKMAWLMHIYQFYAFCRKIIDDSISIEF